MSRRIIQVSDSSDSDSDSSDSSDSSSSSDLDDSICLRVHDFRRRLLSSNSANDKIAICKQVLSENEPLATVIRMIYDPTVTFGITGRGIDKWIKRVKPRHQNLISLLQQLADRKLSGDAALEAAASFITANPDYTEDLYCVFDRDLKAKISVANLNKALPGFIPVFAVALAQSAEDSMPVVNPANPQAYFISRKLDGVRSVAVKRPGHTPVIYSRTGNPFLSVRSVVDELAALPGDSWVLDGEMCIVENGVENFQKVVGEIKKLTPPPKNAPWKFQYVCFDLLTLEEFDSHEGKRPFAERYQALQAMIPHTTSDSAVAVGDRTLIVLAQLPYSQENFERMTQLAAAGNWEGLMLRRNVGYAGKRSKDLLKIKKFQREEYEVVNIQQGTKGILTEGRVVQTPVMAAVEIRHKDHSVFVGSGFTDEQRVEFLAHPDRIIGKQISVQFFEETRDRNGGISLRFPTVQAIYDGARDI